MEIILLALVVVVLAAAVAVGLRTRRRPSPEGVTLPGARVEGGRVVVPLDVPATDPENPSVIRLVDDASNQVFLQASEEIEEVEVQNRSGVTLGTRSRGTPREIALPEQLSGPRSSRRRGPEIPSNEMSETGGETRSTDPRPAPADESVAPQRSLADRFELPESVRSRLRDPSDPVDLVRAILETAGTEPQVDDDVLKVGDQVAVVIRSRVGQSIDPASLNHAYSRFKESGARRGVVVTPGSMSQRELRRRQAFDPNLLHAGPEGIQRMADAAEVGANPIDLAATPAAEH